MAFVLEIPTEKQRKERGFAPTTDDVKVGLGMRFAHIWAYDKESDAVLVCTSYGPKRWRFELHLNQAVTFITTEVEEVQWEEPKDDSGLRKYDTFFEITELLIQESLSTQVEKLKLITIEALKVYGHGTHKYYGNGYATISPDITIRFLKTPKSKLKESEFATKH